MTRIVQLSPPSSISLGCGSSQRGVSLVESLIATALLAFVAISIFPLLHQSVAANINGSDSNQAIHHGLSELERMLSMRFDSPFFEMEESKRLSDHTIEAEGNGHRMVLGSQYFDPEANADPPVGTDLTHHIATGAWIPDAADATGLVLWHRRGVIRQYSYADIGEGVIDAGAGGEIVRAGHANLFDSPLQQDALDPEVNFVEEDVTIESLRPGSRTLQTKLARIY